MYDACAYQVCYLNYHIVCERMYLCTCVRVCVCLGGCKCLHVYVCVCEYACMGELASAPMHMCKSRSRYDQHPVNRLFPCVSYKYIYLKPSEYTVLNTPIGIISITACKQREDTRTSVDYSTSGQIPS